MLMSRGARAAPRLGFSMGKRGFCRAWESIEGVQIPHSSTRTCFGEEKIKPRAMPGSVNRLRHIPTDEPLSLRPTQRQNKISAPIDGRSSNADFIREVNLCRGALSRFPKNQIRRRQERLVVVVA